MIVGLRRRPGQWRGEEIYRDYSDGSGHVLVTFRAGERMESRSPNHYETRRLCTAYGESLVEIRRADLTTETYRSSLVAFQPEDGELLVLEPEGQGERVFVGAAGMTFRGSVESPDLTKPQWRQVYEDIRTAIEKGELKPGDRIPTVDHLVKMYTFSSSSILKALQILQTESWIQGRSRVGRFVSACRYG